MQITLTVPDEILESAVESCVTDMLYDNNHLKHSIQRMVVQQLEGKYRKKWDEVVEILVEKLKEEARA